MSTITIIELLGEANMIRYETYDPFTPYLAVAVIYYIMYVIVEWGIRLTEQRLTRHLQ